MAGSFFFPDPYLLNLVIVIVIMIENWQVDLAGKRAAATGVGGFGHGREEAAMDSNITRIGAPASEDTFIASKPQHVEHLLQLWEDKLRPHYVFASYVQSDFDPTHVVVVFQDANLDVYGQPRITRKRKRPDEDWPIDD